MFEAIKIGRKVSKADYDAQVPELRTQLLAAQRQLRQTRHSVIVIVAGVDGAGKGEVINTLHEWLDTRGVQTYGFWDESDEEHERPYYWRFWRALPARGEMAILFGGWYLAPITCRYRNHCTEAELEAELARIAEYERMLTADGALIIKFWFHLDEKEQKKRLKALAQDDKSRWKMLPQKAEFSEQYQRFEQIGEHLIRHTDSGTSPWHLIEATDKRYRDLTVGQTLYQTIHQTIHRPAVMMPPVPAPTSAGTLEPALAHLPENHPAQVTILDTIDLRLKLDSATYKQQLASLQPVLNQLAWQAYQQKRSCVLVFEGMDAGGKGGTIRRFTRAVDARLYRTIQVAAPTDEERAHHYLWRFWRHIPRAGRITLYDRSWYGRVLVERVEGFATPADWQRAYAEINHFEEQLVESGVILMKFWLQISQEEQLARFQERQNTPYKQYKITAEDWRNRERWGEYKTAIHEMITRTSTQYAPWTLIAGDDKYYARIQVLKTVRDTIREGLKKNITVKSYRPAPYQRTSNTSNR